MAQFVIKKTKSGVMFNLTSSNKQVIATSQVYASKDTCRKGIKSVMKNAKSPIEDQTAKVVKKLPNPKYEVYKDKKGEFRFRLKAGNAQIIAVSEGYKSMTSLKSAIASIGKTAPTAEIVNEE